MALITVCGLWTNTSKTDNSKFQSSSYLNEKARTILAEALEDGREFKLLIFKNTQKDDTRKPDVNLCVSFKDA
jgi:hypothetical protein